MSNTIIDIGFMNDEAYLMKKHSLSLYEFEKQISDIEYSSVYEPYRQIKDEYGAEKVSFPPINIVFYKEIFENGTVPAPMSFTEKYFEYYKQVITVTEDIVCYANQKFSYSSVVGRILRTYPSLIRDFDFFLRLSESRFFDQVICSCKTDTDGKDIVLKTNGKKYTVSLFVDTSRANFFKALKNKNRHIYGDSEIKVPLRLKDAKKCGDFFVYDDSHVEQIKNQIKSLSV